MKKKRRKYKNKTGRPSKFLPEVTEKTVNALKSGATSDRLKNNEKTGKGSPPKDKRWRPGQSGNPKGRPPKELCLTSRVTERLNQKCPSEVTKATFRFGPPPDRKMGNITWLDVFVERALSFAVSGKPGSVSAIGEIWSRLEGKVKEIVSIPDPIRQEINVKREFDADRTAGVIAALIEAGVLAKGSNFNGADPQADQIYPN